MARDREPDAGMDRLLRSVLADGSAGAAGACPPAEELAAYAERALTDQERETIEGHLAACGRCQDALALLAAMPEPAAAPSVASPAPSWWRAGGWKRWLVPVSAAACGVVLYVAIGPDATLQPAVEPEKTVVVATAPAQVPGQPKTTAAEAAPPPVAAGPRAAAKGRSASDAAPSSAPSAGPSLRRERPVPPLEAQAGKSVAADDLQALRAAPGPVPERLGPPAPIGQDAARPPVAPLVRAPVAVAPVPPPPLAPPAAPAPTAPEAGQRAAREEMVVTGELPRVEFRAAIASATPALVRAAGSPDVMWRLGPGARISGSGDGGQTWRLQHAGPGEIVAGSSPSRTVCWAVGAAGLVLLANDGEAWNVRPFPERVDLVAVTATSARDAVVTARTGQRFTTGDGGTTWTPLAPSPQP